MDFKNVASRGPFTMEIVWWKGRLCECFRNCRGYSGLFLHHLHYFLWEAKVGLEGYETMGWDSVSGSIESEELDQSPLHFL